MMKTFKGSAMDTPLSLIERLRDPTDAASWRRLVDLYSPLIRRWLRRTLQEADEDDLVQEILGAMVPGSHLYPLRSGRVLPPLAPHNHGEATFHVLEVAPLPAR